MAQNYTEAIRWFRLSANQGNNFAQASLGLMFRKGQSKKLRQGCTDYSLVVVKMTTRRKFNNSEDELRELYQNHSMACNLVTNEEK